MDSSNLEQRNQWLWRAPPLRRAPLKGQAHILKHFHRNINVTGTQTSDPTWSELKHLTTQFRCPTVGRFMSVSWNLLADSGSDEVRSVATLVPAACSFSGAKRIATTSQIHDARIYGAGKNLKHPFLKINLHSNSTKGRALQVRSTVPCVGVVEVFLETRDFNEPFLCRKICPCRPIQGHPAR